MRRGGGLAGIGAAGLLLLLAFPGAAEGQELADYDYENLSFRGIGVEGGYLMPNRVNPTSSVGVRFDLGYLGPGLRIVPGITYWSSTLQDSEVRRLETRVRDLVARELDPDADVPEVSLGEIRWSDVALSLDGHVVWRTPYRVLPYAGVGMTAHLLNGQGAAVDDTFVEDLLDSIRAGVNLHAGLEVPAHERFRLYGQARGELLGHFQYLEIRLGGQIMVGPSLPGERGRR